MDVGVELVDHAGELLDLGRCVELRLVAHEVVEAAVGLGVLRRRARRGRASGPTSTAAADTPRRDDTTAPSRSSWVQQQPAEATAGEVVVDLEGEGALARAHRPVGEPQHGHAHRSYTSVVSEGARRCRRATMALLSGRTRLRSSSQPSSPRASHGGEGEGVGAVLDLLAQGGAGLGEGAVAVDEAPLAEARDRRVPRRRRPTGATPGARRAGTSPDAAWNTSASIPSRPASTRQAMWPSPRNSRSSVMACQSASTGSSGQGSDGVAGVERTAGGGARRRRRCGPARRRAAPTGRRGGRRRLAAAPVRRRVEPRLEQRLRRGRLPRRGDGVVDDGRVEVEERGDHDLGRHRAHRRRTRGEVAVEAHHAERLVGRRRLGREVDQPVVRLEGPPHLPRHHRFHGAGP